MSTQLLLLKGQRIGYEHSPVNYSTDMTKKFVQHGVKIVIYKIRNMIIYQQKYVTKYLLILTVIIFPSARWAEV